MQVSARRVQRARRVGAAMLVAAGLAMAAGAVRAQTWNLHTVIDPPLLPDVDPADHMGFGTAVSVGSTPWLVVGAPLADCANSAGPGTIADTGRIFIYKRVNGVWNYHQSFCASSPVQNARYGSALDVSQSWLIVGAPGAASDIQGTVEMFYLDKVTQQWSRQLTTVGGVGSQLGHSVAIDRGLAVAGEPGYNAQRGRLRTWKLDGSTVTAQPHYAPAGLVDTDRYGRKVAVQSNGCELPTCTSFTDVVVAIGGSPGVTTSKLYIAKRNAGAWQASQTIFPPVGAEFNWPGTLDVSHYQVVATMNIQTASPAIGCPAGRAVRVYYRSGGNFTSLGDACPPPTQALTSFGSAVAADRGTTWFYASATDSGLPGTPSALEPATVSTFAGHPAIGYIDSVQELNLAPAGTALEAFNDNFGASISAWSTYMAVGAPWKNPYFGFPGIGYVAVYITCC